MDIDRYIVFIKKPTRMTILTIFVTIWNTQRKTYHKIWPNESSYLYLTRKR